MHAFDFITKFLISKGVLRRGERFKMGVLARIAADSSRAFQACGQRTASAVQILPQMNGRQRPIIGALRLKRLSSLG